MYGKLQEIEQEALRKTKFQHNVPVEDLVQIIIKTEEDSVIATKTESEATIAAVRDLLQVVKNTRTIIEKFPNLCYKIEDYET